ncbi:monovalent cation/H+ antiporter complex subunit F [Ponticaulis profundi]|uniref:Monovalent cation/H+ antiporter complex subunit F n=1 Tax=Ponticaulis profundi TaxID=2665222 RepID=A0ABW1S445_9PROT|tara:strand:- start:139 stop:447 length:309 start_codon:yes stop_codon:yes gene_type:complete
MILLAVSAIALFVAIALLLIRLFVGPSLYDRVLALNSVGTKILILLALVGFLMGRPDFLDIALLYALINFVSTIAILKFFRYRSFQVPLIRVPDSKKERSNG